MPQVRATSSRFARATSGCACIIRPRGRLQVVTAKESPGNVERLRYVPG
jgi:hypothetical protein